MQQNAQAQKVPLARGASGTQNSIRIGGCYKVPRRQSTFKTATRRFYQPFPLAMAFSSVPYSSQVSEPHKVSIVASCALARSVSPLIR